MGVREQERSSFSATILVDTPEGNDRMGDKKILTALKILISIFSCNPSPINSYNLPAKAEKYPSEFKL